MTSIDPRGVPWLTALLFVSSLGGCDGRAPDPETVHLGATSAQLGWAAVAPVRQISVRSPFGDVGATGNLALDGDFELEQGANSSAWYVFDATGAYGSLTVATGGRCRSGLYCAEVAAGATLEDLYVPIRPGTAGTLTFAAKPAGACSDVDGEIDLGADAEGIVYDAFVAQPTAPSPGPDGWCTFEAHFTADRPLYQWTQVTFSSASETLFDDVVVLASPEAKSLAERERRAGDPGKGRALVAGRRAAVEAGQKHAAVLADSRRGRRMHGG